MKAETEQIHLKDFPLPKSHLQRVLFRLIFRGRASLRDFGQLQGLRTRFSEINREYGINLDIEIGKGMSEFGNPTRYHIHILPDDQKEKAKKVYLAMHGIEY